MRRLALALAAASLPLLALAVEQHKKPDLKNDPLSLWDTPEWWAANPIAREGLRVQCARRAPADQMMLRYCDVAGFGQHQR